MSGVDNSVETVNAAAVAIVSAESRVQQVTVPRRRWTTWLSVYWCFGSQRNGKRIGHAVLVPEPAFQMPDAPAIENPTNPPEVRLPFVAPPSSPASFLPSGTPSAMQSPAGSLSFSALSPSSYSPSGPTSIFATGPYANDTQLVSPPVFSTFTTEPSTAPLTPPPEPLHQTTPSSPEVPFAKLLTSLDANCTKSEAYEFQSYQLYPGSPIGRLISPSSACSGTSSPFPDPEYSSSGISFQSFPIGEPPKILSAEGIAARKLIPRHARNGGSLLDGQISAAASLAESAIVPKNNEHSMDNRVSFDLTAEEFTRCLEKKAATSGEGTSQTFTARNDGVLLTNEADSSRRIGIDETYNDLPEKPRPSVNLHPSKEFNFDNSDGVPAEPSVGSDWWANEKVIGTATEHRKGWAFMPMVQPGVS